MRLGIRGKLIGSFMAMVLLPVLAVLVVGFHSEQPASAATALRNVMALLIPFIIGGIVFAWIVSDDILRPLRQLRKATDKIVRGDFDFELDYGNNHEIDDFCAAFDVMRAELQASLQKQAQLEQARNSLIAGISHDLRTPMSSIKGYVEGLLDSTTYDELKFERYLRVIKNKADSLDRLIDELFRFTHIDIEGYNTDLAEHDAENLLERLLAPFEFELEEAVSPLHLARPFPSVTIVANESSVAQLLGNLIDNAQRYGDNTQPIAVAAKAVGGYLEVSVTNSGTAISLEDVPHLFDPFYRAEKSRSRHYGGTGLGLAICKQIVELHGGSIWVERPTDSTTAFVFTLPLAAGNVGSASH